MAYQREIVGGIDGMGYLYCIRCLDDCVAPVVGNVEPVYVDSSPHNAECCDECGQGLSEKAFTRTHALGLAVAIDALTDVL